MAFDYDEAEITKGCRARNIYLTQPKCLASFEQWIAVRLRRGWGVGPEVYRACDALQQTISRLYRQSGIKLGSSHSGRRSLAARVLAATGDVETVQTILGHQHLDLFYKLGRWVDPDTLRRAFEIAL